MLILNHNSVNEMAPSALTEVSFSCYVFNNIRNMKKELGLKTIIYPIIQMVTTLPYFNN